MKRPSEQTIIGILLPITTITSVVLTLIALVAFQLNAQTAGFLFTAGAAVAWLCVITEFLLVYETLVDRWFSRERSVVAAVWFLIAVFLAFELTPEKGVDWKTVMTLAGLFALLFLVPYYIYTRIRARYGEQISRMLGNHKREAEKEQAIQIGATLNKTTDAPRISQEDEIKKYDSLIAAISPELVKAMPLALQTNDALFLLVLFREDGYLDQAFKPIIRNERTNEIHKTLYAYIAHTMSLALKITTGKWKVFEEFWSLSSPAQLLSRFMQDTNDNPNEHQKRIGQLYRKATRMRPKLETYDLGPLMKL